MCNIIIPLEDTKILEFNQNQKFDKTPFIFYANLECLIGKIYRCKNNLESVSTTKLIEHVPSGFSMSTILSLKRIENNHNVYRVKDCMKKFCESLREYAMEIINSKKNEVFNK